MFFFNLTKNADLFNSFIINFIPALIAVAGICLTYIFTRWREMEKEINNKKSEFYLTYIELFSKWDCLDDNNNSEIDKVETGLDVYEKKIILYGNEKVIKANAELNKALHNFIIKKCKSGNPTEKEYFKKYKADNVIEFYNTEDGRRLYIELIIKMREDIGLKGKGLEYEDYCNSLDYFLYKAKSQK